MIMPTVHRQTVLGIVVLSVGCSSLLGSEAGLPVPKDPGTIVVSVRDAGGGPIDGVEVQVHDIPNSVGTTYTVGQWTDRNGVARISDIPAGLRRVEMKLPAGFRVFGDPLIKPVDVIRGASVSVIFVLQRQ